MHAVLIVDLLFPIWLTPYFPARGFSIAPCNEQFDKRGDTKYLHAGIYYYHQINLCH